MFPDLRLEEADDPAFLQLLSRLIRGVLAENKPQEVYIVTIDNWFDHKWLKFSGIGVVPFEFPAFMNRDDGALDEFRQPQVTIPPFSPGRVVAQRYFHRGRDGFYTEAEPPTLLQKISRQRSAKNLHRRIHNVSDSAVFVWYSSNTLVNERASVMVYSVKNQHVETWFAAFRKDADWKLHLTHGVDRDHMEQLTSPSDAKPA